MSTRILAPSAPAVNSGGFPRLATDAPPQPWYYSLIPTDDRMTAEQAEELDAYLDWIEAEADQLEMVARGDELEDEFLGMGDNLLMWPRGTGPDHRPAA